MCFRDVEVYHPTPELNALFLTIRLVTQGREEKFVVMFNAN